MKTIRTYLKPVNNKLTEVDYIDGCSWYIEANQQAQRISLEYKVDFLKVCGIISALSPSVAWEVNLSDAENLIAHLVYTNETCTVSTYGNNVIKAESIFYCDGSTKEIERILLGVSGYKTHSFYLNISGIDQNAVTIDRHILKAINFKGKSLTRKRYYETAQKIAKKAKELGLLPMDYQAVIWVNFKRINRI